MKKKVSMIVPYDTMVTNIKQGEHWVRTDWRYKDKYVMLADERYCTPRLILVFPDTNEYVIFRPTYNDYNNRWKKIDG